MIPVPKSSYLSTIQADIHDKKNLKAENLEWHQEKIKTYILFRLGSSGNNKIILVLPHDTGEFFTNVSQQLCIVHIWCKISFNLL